MAKGRKRLSKRELRRRQLKRRIYMTMTAGAAVILLVVFGLNHKKEKEENKVEEIAAPMEEAPEKDPVQEALETDQYGAELNVLYQNSPEVEQHRQQKYE